MIGFLLGLLYEGALTFAALTVVLFLLAAARIIYREMGGRRW